MCPLDPDFLFYMRYIYLNIELAKKAVKDNHCLEALAFNILIKKTYTSSMVNNATIRGCKDKFHIGTTRMSRIIKNGIEYGLLKRVDNSIVATKIKGKGLNCKLEFEDRDYTLSEVIDMIRNSLVLDHIRKQTYVVDTVRMAREPENNAMRKAGAMRMKKKSMSTVKKAYKTLSNQRIMKLANVKRYRASILTKKLLCSGRITKNSTIVEMDIDPKNFTADFIRWRKNSDARGSLFSYKGKIYCKLANSYKYSCDAIRIF